MAGPSTYAQGTAADRRSHAAHPLREESQPLPRWNQRR